MSTLFSPKDFNSQLQEFISKYIEDESKKAIDIMIEESVSKFREQCENKRAEILVKLMARVMDNMQSMDKEITIKIPVYPHR